MKEKAVCLVSGGLDSCVAAALAASSGYKLAFLHISYGQRTEARERRAFEDIASYFKAGHQLVSRATHLHQVGGSALTDPSITLQPGNLDRRNIPLTYVPFRNANFLSMAVSWAEVLRARVVYIGAVEEDSSGYPDCRAAFFEAFNEVIRAGTRPETQVQICTPLLHMDKKSIVQTGHQLNAPLHLTWSCYSQDEKACGHCDSCLLRLRGFAEAGTPDPIPYAG